MSAPRKPAAFRLEPEAPPQEQASFRHARLDAPSARKPRTVKADMAVVTPAEIDVFDEPDIVAAEPPPATAPRSRSLLASIFFGAFGVLVSLAVGLWTDQLIRDLFERAEWLGWLAAAMAAIALLALLVILVREFLAIARLAEVEKLQKRALDAVARDDPKAAQAVVDELSAFVAAKPETAAGRRSLAELRGEIIDGGNLVRLAETEILGPLDARAKVMILEAAKRVSLVTAVSPRALVDVAYVVFEAGRLIRRLVGALWRPTGHTGVLPAGAQCSRPSGGYRLDRRRRQFRAADRRPRPRRPAVGEARRRRRQRHDDGAHRHSGDGDGAAPALHRRQAARAWAISCPR